jgi:hypothetical protein
LVLGASAVYSDDNQANKLAHALDGTISNVAIHSRQIDAAEANGPTNNQNPTQPKPDTMVTSDLIPSLELARAFDHLNDAFVVEHQGDWQLDQGAIEFTFSTDNPEQTQGILSKDASYFGNGGHFTAYVEDKKLIVRLQSDDKSYTVETSNDAIQSGVENHVIASFGSEGLKLIFNGKLVDTNAYTGGLAGNEEPLVLGASAVYSDDNQANKLAHALDGTISNVAIYSESISNDALAIIIGDQFSPGEDSLLNVFNDLASSAG